MSNGHIYAMAMLALICSSIDEISRHRVVVDVTYEDRNFDDLIRECNSFADCNTRCIRHGDWCQEQSIPIKLHSAISGEVTTLKTLVIANRGRTEDMGKYEFDYEGWLIEGEFNSMDQLGETEDNAKIFSFPQRKKDGEFTDPAELVLAMLNALGFGYVRYGRDIPA